MTLDLLIHFGMFLLVHILDTPLQTQTHTQCAVVAVVVTVAVAAVVVAVVAAAAMVTDTKLLEKHPLI